MPVAYDTTAETTLPSATQRRVWAFPDVQSHSLVVLTFERLHVAPLAGAPKPEVISAIEAGGSLTELLGPFAVDIDLATVRHVRLDLLANSLVIEYGTNVLALRRLTIMFATPEAADACFTKLWRRVGDDLQLQPYQRDSWTLARAPLALLLGVLLATAVATLVLSVFEDMSAERMSLPPWGWLDWRWVCGAGGVAAAISQVWLYRRLTRPPLALELRRT